MFQPLFLLRLKIVILPRPDVKMCFSIFRKRILRCSFPGKERSRNKPAFIIRKPYFPVPVHSPSAGITIQLSVSTRHAASLLPGSQNKDLHPATPDVSLTGRESDFPAFLVCGCIPCQPPAFINNIQRFIGNYHAVGDSYWQRVGNQSAGKQAAFHSPKDHIHKRSRR